MGILSGAGKGAAMGSVAGPVGTAIGAVLGGLGGWLSSKKQNDAEKAQRGLDNQYMAAMDAAKSGVLSDVLASGWNPYGVNSLGSSGTSTSSGSSRSNTAFQNESHKITEAANQGMENKLRALIEGRLGTASVGAGERANAIRAINQATAGAQRQIQNLVGSRGIAAPAAGAAYTPLATARSGQIAQYLGTTVPELQRTREMDLENQANQFLLPRMGERQAGTSQTNSNFSQSGTQSGTHQVGPDIGAALALRSPTGPMQTQNTGYSAFGSGLQNAGPLVPALTDAWSAWKNRKPAGSASTGVYDSSGNYMGE